MARLSILLALLVFPIPADAQWFLGRGRPTMEAQLIEVRGAESCWLRDIGAINVMPLEADPLRRISRAEQPRGSRWALWLGEDGAVKHARRRSREAAQTGGVTCPWPEAQSASKEVEALDEARLARMFERHQPPCPTCELCDECPGMDEACGLLIEALEHVAASKGGAGHHGAGLAFAAGQVCSGGSSS